MAAAKGKYTPPSRLLLGMESLGLVERGMFTLTAERVVQRCANERNPVLLWVHGGPGMPDYLLTKQYPTNMEDLFTVV